MIWKTLLYASLVYVALCALTFLLQRAMLYLPDKTRLSPGEAAAVGLRQWPSPADYRGFTSLDEPADARGTVVVFHGNAGTAYHRDFYVAALSRLGLRVVLAEYPGYGGRDGRPSEDALVGDALETIRLARRDYGDPLYLWGESLGSGVVCAAVARSEVPVAGLVLFLAWDSLADLAQTHYRYLPARWLVLDRYDNVANLRGYRGRVAVVLAGDDEVVPVRHGRRLYEALTTDKKLWLFEGARHNEMPVADGLPWWGEVVAFVSR
jgi:alpha-beta hydrolase superfamily lysophospholipase